MFVQIEKLRAYQHPKIASERFPRQWPRVLQKSRTLNKWSAALQPVFPHWNRMQRPSPVVPARQVLGIYLDSDGSTATRSVGSHDVFGEGRNETLLHSLLMNLVVS